MHLLRFLRPSATGSGFGMFDYFYMFSTCNLALRTRGCVAALELIVEAAAIRTSLGVEEGDQLLEGGARDSSRRVFHQELVSVRVDVPPRAPPPAFFDARCPVRAWHSLCGAPPPPSQRPALACAASVRCLAFGCSLSPCPPPHQGAARRARRKTRLSSQAASRASIG